MAKIRMRQAVIAALADELRSDPSVILMGEDIAQPGGSFKATEGLLEEFGPIRVRDTPISEMGFTGAAVGAAVMGMHPVVEIMFMEFLGVALDQVVTEAAKFRYLSNGRISVPLTLRATVGAGLGFGCQHSQTLENWLAATPGLSVVVPSDPQTAYSLLRAAVRDPDPVVVLEPRALYASRGEVRTGDDAIGRLRVARIARPGTEATIVGLGATVPAALEATKLADVNAEVIDLQTLYPWDAQTVLESVHRTGRLVVVSEAPRSGAWGHEVVSTITSQAFGDLRAAPLLITAPDVPIPYNRDLEVRYLPSPADIGEQLIAFVADGQIPAPWWVREGVSV